MVKIFPNDIKAPVAKKIPHTLSLHGDTRVDPYYWMKERDSAPVLSHLKAEASYCEAMTASWRPLEEELFKEMKGRVKQDDSSPPAKNGDYFYYSRFVEGYEYPLYCRKHLSLTANEEIILDVNALAKGQRFTSISCVRPSPDHKMIVFGVDFTGRRFYDLYLKNLATGTVSKQDISQTTGDVVWAETLAESASGYVVFYTKQNPETLRSEKVIRYSLKSDSSEEICFEADEVFHLDIAKSQNDKFIWIVASSFDSSEIKWIPSDKPSTPPKIFLSRETKHEYAIDDGDDGLYIMTNWKAENFRLMKTSLEKSEKENWIEIVPHRADVLLTDMLVLKNHVVLEERAEGLSRIEIFDRRKFGSADAASLMKFPDPCHVVALGANYEYDTAVVRYNYQSPVAPPSVFDYDFATTHSTAVKVSEVPTYDSHLYASERAWATASDGVKIPVSIVYRKDLRTPGKNPMLVYGYGSYGYSLDPHFRSSVVSLLDRGFIYALAHVRGGSEMGRAWYENGRMMAKKNTFTDFNTVTEFLVTHKYADPKKVFAWGGSAGGLLMGAIVNLRPDLYRGIISEVPFVDVLTTMLDPDLPLTVGEYEQWGNPNQQDAYFFMKSYSPYDCLVPQPYPATLLVTGYHDSQVQYWEPAKYAAKLRDVTTSDQPVLLKIDMDSGHSGASGRFQALKDVASKYAFAIKLAGADDEVS